MLKRGPTPAVFGKSRTTDSRAPAGALVWKRLISFCILGFIFAAVWCKAPMPAQSQEQLEYRVKAAFLLNFSKFVEWPARTPAVESPVSICILGYDPFGATVDRLVEGESVGSRRIVVQRVRTPLPEPTDCDVVFVSQREKEVEKVLAAFGQGVLTVGEGDEFLREGGMIALVIDNRRVRFDINQTAVRNASLKLSARLLSVARSVKE